MRRLLFDLLRRFEQGRRSPSASSASRMAVFSFDQTWKRKATLQVMPPAGRFHRENSAATMITLLTAARPYHPLPVDRQIGGLPASPNTPPYAVYRHAQFIQCHGSAIDLNDLKGFATPPVSP